jgi:hypothetical protein
MTRRTLRASAPLALLLAAGALVAPPVQAAAHPAPQNSCTGAFCTTFDVGTTDASAPTQPATAAAQPANLSLRFTNTSAAVGTDKSSWLATVSAQLGTSSAKGMLVTDPATLPLGSYVAGSAASASSCQPGPDGSQYVTTCPAGYGTGHAELTPFLPGSSAIYPVTFGIRSIRTGIGGALTADVSTFVSGVSLPGSEVISLPVTVTPATATAGPAVAIDVRSTLMPLTYQRGDLSLNTMTLNLNGLVTEATAGAVSPAAAFVRNSLSCTSVTSTLAAQSRSAAVTTSPFTQTVTGCPSAPVVVSVQPVAGQPRTFAFTMTPPAAATPGRTASLEWVFGDGAKAATGATTTHTYPVDQPVTAVVTTVDSAGARSNGVQVEIGATALRGKQREGHLITGQLTDQDTGTGIGDQPLLAYRCATRSTPVGQCDQIASATTKPSGAYRLRIPEVRRKGFVLVTQAGTGRTASEGAARFGSSRYIAVLPQPEVTLKVSDKRVRPGATVRLTGTVAPGKKGKTVRLQGFVRGKWRSIGKATVSKHGTYATTYVVRPLGQDKRTVRALVEGTAATLMATSKVRVIRFVG